MLSEWLLCIFVHCFPGICGERNEATVLVTSVRDRGAQSSPTAAGIAKPKKTQHIWLPGWGTLQRKNLRSFRGRGQVQCRSLLSGSFHLGQVPGSGEASGFSVSSEPGSFNPGSEVHVVMGKFAWSYFEAVLQLIPTDHDCFPFRMILQHTRTLITSYYHSSMNACMHLESFECVHICMLISMQVNDIGFWNPCIIFVHACMPMPGWV